MQPKLRGEIGDGPRPKHARVSRSPSLFGIQILLHPTIGIVDSPMQHQLARPLLKLLDRHVFQQRNRIVIEGSPADRIKFPKELSRLVVPTPPKIASQGPEALIGG